jgi:hypothetical protein
VRELVVESRPDPVRVRVPVRLEIFGRSEEVEAVVDWWPGTDYHYFRVRVRSGSEYVLRHDVEADAWRVDFFRRDAEGVR